MNFKKEITVEVKSSREELIRYLDNNFFNKKEEYTMYDIYYVKKDYNLDNDIFDILNNCILIRNVGNKILYYVYKYKEYDDKGNIIKDGKAKVEIKDIEKAKEFLENIGYKEFINIKDLITVYEKNNLEFAVEYVNDRHLYIEIEENETYDTIEKLIDALEKTKINYDRSNYFAKKAKLIYEETYKQE